EYFYFQAEDGIRDRNVTGVQTCALPIFNRMVAGYSTIWLTDIFRTTRCRRFCRNASTKIEDLMWEATQESIAPCGVPLRLYRTRSEEHTSELQSRFDLVCRLLLEKKKQ